MHDVVQELRVAIRAIARRPGLSAVAVVTLALAIGANSALFTVVNSVLLNPLPFADPDQLVILWETRSAPELSESTVSLANFEDWRRLSAVFQAMAAIRERPYNLTGGGDPVRASGHHVTAGLLPLLGVRPALGRGFRPAEQQPGAAPVCMISHGLWHQRFGGDPEILDQELRLDGRSHAVVGVLPAGFELPGLGPRQVLTPLVLDPAHPNYRGNHNSYVLARLRNGVTVAQAHRQLAALARRLEEEYPQWNDGVGAVLRPLKEEVVRNARVSVLVLFATVGFVLLLACVNLAALLLARASERQPEMAVRTALGAGRGRLVRSLLAESVALSGMGGILGLGLACGAVRALVTWGPQGMPRLSEVSLDLRVVAFTAAVALATGVLFGLAPALRSTRVDLRTALSRSGRLPGLGGHRPQRLLVAAEVTMATLLLIGAGLLGRSFVRLLDVDPGFESADRIAMSLSLSAAQYPEREQVSSFFAELTAAVRTLPGVAAAGAGLSLPFEGSVWRKHLTLEERPALTLAEVPVANYTLASPGFLETLGVPLLRGRPLGPGDHRQAPFVALVNQSLVRTHYPDQDPLGRRIRLCAPNHLLAPELRDYFPWYTIVGVVGDVKRRGLTTSVEPEVFVPLAQDADRARAFFVVAQGTGGVADRAAALRRAVWEIDPGQPIAWVRTLDAMYSDQVSRPRFNLILSSAFGVTALALAAMGLYGLLAHSVALRTSEIGLRMALGARPEGILWRLVGQGLGLAVTGVVLGMAVAFGVTRLMHSMLFGVTPTDPLTFALVALFLLVVALLAAYVPALRASRLDPCDALRWE